MNNTKGLHLEFEIADDKTIKASFECDKAYEGYSGILHGGIISSILDGAMGNCLFARGLTAVTVEMNTKFKLPVQINKPAAVTARIEKICHPLYFLKAEIIQDGKTKAVAKAKFFDKPELAYKLEMF
ncbi:MAG: PaaI family thioesterase [Phycisphaerae bacterium]|nr:PaaI family thioesterase [Phycisphaerae bacterium]